MSTHAHPHRHTATGREEPDSPTDLTKPSWRYIARRTFREFSSDQCTDVAATLTYYSVLALFPAVIAVLSLIGLAGQGQSTIDAITSIQHQIGMTSVADNVTPLLQELSTSSGNGVALIVGLLVALWSASGYVNAFGRGMNRIYGFAEGRPVWKLRPVMLLVTLITVVLCAAVLLGLVVTGPAAKAVGDQIGLGDTAVLVWGIAKWPVMLAMVMLVVALLYWATPNVKQPRFRWLSVGAGVAILVWVVASAAFALYVAGFSHYGRTYGSLAGVIVFLLWLWITNLALLFGAELDAELERGRQLQAGIPAERDLQLEPRDTRQLEKAERKQEKDIELGRRLRQSHGEEE
jgi:membrane protein